MASTDSLGPTTGAASPLPLAYHNSLNPGDFHVTIKIALLFVFVVGIAFPQTPEEDKINHSAERWMTICKSVVNADVGNNGVVHVPDP
jgi:hypothetical protein